MATEALIDVPSSRTLREEVAELEHIFEASLNECDVPAAVRAILSLEETIQGWAGDTEQSDASRDRLLSAGIELHDTPEGTTWSLPQGNDVPAAPEAAAREARPAEASTL